MRETWYLLEDGSTAHPNDVAPDDKGFLRTKAGVAVKMKGDVPHTTGVDVDDKPKRRDLKAEEPKRTYKTR